MDVSHVEMTCAVAKGIRCPYTKNEYKVVMHICGDVVTYSAPGAFSLRTPRRTLKQLMDDASMRGGVRGAASGIDAATDAHTGETLVLAHDRRGYWFENAFDPSQATMDLATFLRALSCGERNVTAPDKAISIEHPGELTEDDSDLAHKSCEELSQETADKMVRVMPGVTHGRNTVSMSIGTVKKSKKQKKSKKSKKAKV